MIYLIKFLTVLRLLKSFYHRVDTMGNLLIVCCEVSVNGRWAKLIHMYIHSYVSITMSVVRRCPLTEVSHYI
jgi:hypothetical protein